MNVLDPSQLPAYDDQGCNLVDPNDRRGLKTAYISRVQAMALERYVGRGTGWALDVGCGYGRMSGALRALGWDVIGVDPSQRILQAARDLAPDGNWCVARLPELPFRDGIFDLVLAQSLLRVLHLNQVLRVSEGLPRLVKPGGRLVVVDNIRRHHRAYVPEEWIIDTFARLGLSLTLRVPIRAARWWGIYAVRYGLIPRALHCWLADYELRHMARRHRLPRWQYHNVLYVFERPQ